MKYLLFFEVAGPKDSIFLDRLVYNLSPLAADSFKTLSLSDSSLLILHKLHCAWASASSAQTALVACGDLATLVALVKLFFSDPMNLFPVISVRSIIHYSCLNLALVPAQGFPIMLFYIECFSKEGPLFIYKLLWNALYAIPAILLFFIILVPTYAITTVLATNS